MASNANDDGPFVSDVDNVTHSNVSDIYDVYSKKLLGPNYQVAAAVLTLAHVIGIFYQNGVQIYSEQDKPVYADEA